MRHRYAPLSFDIITVQVYDFVQVSAIPVLANPLKEGQLMKRFALFLCAAAWAIAQPAAAQNLPLTGHLSTDWTVSQSDPLDLIPREQTSAPIAVEDVVFAPYVKSYEPRGFLNDFQKVRRYGGRLTIPVSTVFPFLSTDLVIEGEGARDYGPAARKSDVGRLRITKPLDRDWSIGFEAVLLKNKPRDLTGVPHIDSEIVGAIHVTKVLGAR